MTGTYRWGDLVVTGQRRREEVRRRSNGLDGVEVRHGGLRLLLAFLEELPEGVEPSNIRLEGPPGSTPVKAVEVRAGGPDEPDLQRHLVVELDRPGSVGRYRLQLVEPGPHGHPGLLPMHGIDPQFSEATFSFDTDRLNPVRPRPPSAPGLADESDITYLARDYEGFRQLMLDRMAITIPAWTERHVADLGVMIVELLAYVADDLSYYQDSVATEAYLSTARLRTSVRRHLRLVGYRMHEGTNARAWISLQVDADGILHLDQVRFAAVSGLDPNGEPLVPATDLELVDPTSVQVFTPFPSSSDTGPAGQSAGTRQPAVVLREAHNCINLWTWGEEDALLTQGATSAVLKDGPPESGGAEGNQRVLHLEAGDVLMFEEVVAESGVGPGDPSHRHPVRLTSVSRSEDELYRQPVVHVTWSHEDALPFPLQVSAPGGQDGVVCTVLRGNVVLADNGAARTEQVAMTLPQLSTPDVTFACAFPDPSVVARHQAQQLRRLYGDWRAEIEQWWRAARHGAGLDDDQVAQLRHQFGRGELEGAGLEGDNVRQSAEAAERVLCHLLVHADRILSRRIARLDVLAGLASSSGPLDAVRLDEVRQDWGPRLAASLDPDHPAAYGSAARAIKQDPRQARPKVTLSGPTAGGSDAGIAAALWTPALDLLETNPGDHNFVVDVDDNGLANLRFDPSASIPATATFTANYQVGRGTAANVAAEAVNVIVDAGAGPRTGPPATGPASPATAPSDLPDALPLIRVVRNPLPAMGGVDPETIANAKSVGPGAYLSNQPRAITAEDYGRLAATTAGVRRAAAALDWNGARWVADVVVQPQYGEIPRTELIDAVHHSLAPLRRIGHDVSVRGPRYRSLFLKVDVTLKAGAIRSDLAHQFSRLLSDGWLDDGTPAMFNPANLGFGQALYASAIESAIQAQPGVETLAIKQFSLDDPHVDRGTTPPEQLTTGRLDIIRMDNDERAPEHGWAELSLRGGH